MVRSSPSQHLINLLFILLLIYSAYGKAEILTSHFRNSSSKGYTLSFQTIAFTSNAGGQPTYSLRLAKEDQEEFTLFSNQYLITGDIPLTGIIYSKRLVWCPRNCPIGSFLQIGGGISSAGGVIEILWSLTPLWIFRIDFASHFYILLDRAVLWSYPLWLGLSIPL